MTAVEVITSVQRRRRWSRDEKLRIVTESARAGRTASQVARDHGSHRPAVHLAASVPIGSDCQRDWG